MLLIVCGVQVRRTDYMNYHITLFCAMLCCVTRLSMQIFSHNIIGSTVYEMVYMYRNR